MSATVAGIFFMVMGAIGFLFPQASFFMDEGWKYKNLEPSSFYLFCIRIGGLIAFFMGLNIVLDPPERVDSAAPKEARQSQEQRR